LTEGAASIRLVNQTREREGKNDPSNHAGRYGYPFMSFPDQA
jgi:hypothetical protein